MRKKDRTAVLERALHALTFAREVSMDADKVRAILDALGAWSRAHSDRNGERSDHTIKVAVDAATQRLDRLLDGTPPSAHERIAALQEEGHGHKP